MRLSSFAVGVSAVLLSSGPATAAPSAELPPIPVTVRVDSDRIVAPLPPIWRFFGADEPNYATAPDGAALMRELGELRHDAVYFRAHNLLTTGDGTADFKWGSTNAYTEKNGKPVYDWRIVDGIIDSYRARGVRPYLEIGFMPEALSSAPKGVPYRRAWKPGNDYKGITAGWSYPPNDYAKWGELIYQWTRHNVARYGRAEVERWYFEVWNEANLDFYWSGNPEQFYRMHDVAIDAVRRALPTARVGGPDVAGSGDAFMDGFLAHVTMGKNYATGKVGTPTDFVSFHAKGQPSVVDGHVRMGIANQLKTADAGFAKIAAVPSLAHKPIVIGENDPEGCAACPGPANAYRNGPLYASYTAASYARLWTLARRRGVTLEGALSWSYTFVGQPWFAGYRQLASNGVDLAVLNVFRLFAKLGENQMAATSDGEVALDTIVRDGVRAAPDVGALATRDRAGKVAILLWNYHDDDVPGPAAAVHVALGGKHGTTARLWPGRCDARQRVRRMAEAG
ncbi:beta-xylosidase [Sphingomonas sp. PvP055]|uniref:GH39 family glycosyl hydrolase n=1 Tax=Sphingomonas sp. PvP055 TaxID=3156391 RepID=UPI00339695EF